VAPHELVLVGGGHAHVQVLREIALRPLDAARVTLVVDQPESMYSGMVPGFVAGRYRRDELAIDLGPLARRAGADLVIAAATGLDPVARRIEVAGGGLPISYDTASFDVGSSVAGLERPGVREHALATRPIGRFVAEVDRLVARARSAASFRVLVVGAGAAGVELALALRARLGAAARIELMDAAARVLPDLAERVSARAARALARRDVSLRLGARIQRAEAGVVVLEGGERIACDALVWAAGAAGVPLFRASGLATDERGFVRVRSTLQLRDHDDVFAAGDCARFEPDLPKAGVYAVRQGPVLERNLRARIAGRHLEAYVPQPDALVLLNLGDGAALGTKWGLAVEGPLVMAAKDAIDRRFVERFRLA